MTSCREQSQLSATSRRQKMDKMARSLFLVVFVCFAICYGFLVKDCSKAGNKLISLTHFNLSRDPIHIPGDETIYGLFDVFLPIAGHNYQVKVIVKKVLGSTYIKIPCFGSRNTTGRIGSCTYDICSELNEQWDSSFCPVTAMDEHSTYSCACPVQPGRYRITAKTYHIPALNSALSAIAQGNYTLHAVISDKRTGEEVGCYEITVTTASDSPCRGPLCIFG